MKTVPKRIFLLLLAAACIGTPATLTAKEKSEAEIMAMLESQKDGDVCSAMLNIEKRFSSNETAIKAIRAKLTDPRPAVQRKAARVLGVLHTDLTADELKAIYGMLKSSNSEVVMDALKSFRGLKAPNAVEEIVPLLLHKDPYIVRDACRTLALIGGKDLVPKIEPLLKSSDEKVKKDAEEAILALNLRK